MADNTPDGESGFKSIISKTFVFLSIIVTFIAAGFAFISLLMPQQIGPKVIDIYLDIYNVTPQVVEIEITRVVVNVKTETVTVMETQIVTEEITRIVESTREVTRVVTETVPIEIEVTREVVVTASPTPTPTYGPDVLYMDDFEDGNATKWNPSGGDIWNVETIDDQYQFVCFRPGTTVFENQDWVDYKVSADVLVTTENVNVGVMGRYIKSDTLYLAQLTGDEARIRRRRNVVAGDGWSNVKVVGYTAEPGVVYNIALEMKGILLIMYVNGEEVAREVNEGHARGTIGLWCGQKTQAVFDNVLVESR